MNNTRYGRKVALELVAFTYIFLYMQQVNQSYLAVENQFARFSDRNFSLIDRWLGFILQNLTGKPIYDTWYDQKQSKQGQENWFDKNPSAGETIDLTMNSWNHLLRKTTYRMEYRGDN